MCVNSKIQQKHRNNLFHPRESATFIQICEHFTVDLVIKDFVYRENLEIFSSSTRDRPNFK